MGHASRCRGGFVDGCFRPEAVVHRGTTQLSQNRSSFNLSSPFADVYRMDQTCSPFHFPYSEMTDIWPNPTLPGVMLRRWRQLHRVKQSHAAELFSVTQSTISRWESGALALDPLAHRTLEKLLAARLSTAADQALGRMVRESSRPVHLICDLTHRLLACSPSRAAQFATPVSELLGRSLWRFATPNILSKEVDLDKSGWREAFAPPALEFLTGNNDSPIVPISQSLCRWTRIPLSDGTTARLVESL